MRAEPTLLHGHDEQVAAWVAERIPHVRGGSFGPCAAIGVGNAQTGKLYAGIVFHQYDADAQNVQLSMAAESPMWATRDTIKRLLAFPFNEWRVFMVWTMTPLENERALKVNEHIGFKRKSIVPHAYGPKKHAQICQMTAHEYARLYGAT